METVYTPQEVADLLKIKKNTVYELIKRGELPSSKVGKQLRVPKEGLESYINRSAPEASPPAAGEEPVKQPGDVILCGQDQLLDLLCAHVEAHPGGGTILRSYMGSYSGLHALYLKKAHITTAHLWDGVEDVYNIPYVRYLVPGIPVVMLHLVKRMEGFYVRKGNPKNIRTFADLAKSNVTMVNRERGSGARVLVDSWLLREGILARAVAGYDNEAHSHMTSAGTVASGAADVAVGIENVLTQFPSLDFIPIQKESLDLVFLKEYENQPIFQAMVEVIRSRDFYEKISSMRGYDASGMGESLVV